MTKNYIPNTNNRYLVCEDGTIENARTHKVLHGTPDMHGYWKVKLYSTPKKFKYYYIHRLVAESWVEIPEKYDPDMYELLTVRHKDGNKANNHPDNLEWCEFADIIKHAFNNGRYEHSTQHRRGKEVVVVCGAKILEFISIKQAATWFYEKFKTFTYLSYYSLIERITDNVIDIDGCRVCMK